MSEFKYNLSAGTEIGLRANNEDNFVVCPDLSSAEWIIPQVSDYADLGEFGALLVVADGMGGHNAGEVASAIAIDTVQQMFTPERLKDVVSDDRAIQNFLIDVVKTADLNILNRAKKDSSTQGMGTTLVMAWILADKVYVCWCGDSRCYMLNKDKGLMRLSKDHSYVQELVDRGELEPQYAMDHPLSNVITRCLGDMDRRAVPDTRIFQLHDGDIILLCSDGLCGYCTDEQILDILIKYHDNPEICKNELISAALNEGGQDNITVALCNLLLKEDKKSEETTQEKEELIKESEEESKETTDALSAKEELQKTQPSSPPVSYPRRKGSSYLWLLLLLFILLAIAIFFGIKNEGWFPIFPTPDRGNVRDTTIVIPMDSDSIVSNLDTTNNSTTFVQDTVKVTHLPSPPVITQEQKGDTISQKDTTKKKNSVVVESVDTLKNIKVKN